MVGARAPGTEQILQRVVFLLFLSAQRDGLWGVAGVPTGAGLVDAGGVEQGGWLGGAGEGSQGPWFRRGGGEDKGGSRGARAKGFGFGGVGGKGTDPRDGANFAMCVVFFFKKKKNVEGCPVGWGVRTGAGLVDGRVDQGPWFQGRVGGSWR